MPSQAAAAAEFCDNHGENMTAKFVVKGCQVLMADGGYPTETCFQGSNTFVVGSRTVFSCNSISTIWLDMQGSHVAVALPVSLLDAIQALQQPHTQSPKAALAPSNPPSTFHVSLQVNISRWFDFDCNVQVLSRATWKEGCQVATSAGFHLIRPLTQLVFYLGIWMPQGVATVDGDTVSR